MFQANQVIGTYTLIKRIGRGGFGEVWLAERRAKFVTTKVAVKLPLDEQVDHEAIKQEAVLWEQASGHPNIVPIIDADEYDGQVVIVSEYAPDGSLDELLKQTGELPTKKAVELVMGILSGLEFLHSKRIIHRDIKPANILLQGETPRLADFGISRVMKTTSVSLQMSGTPSYMAPEAFDRKRNAQTDIWSVGVILYQMIKGSLPFPHENITDLLGAVIMREPEPLPDSVPLSLREIIFKSLAKKPQERYQTAREMRDDLADFLVGISHQSIQPTLREEQLLPTFSGEPFDKTLPLEQLNPTQASPTAKSFIPAQKAIKQIPNQTQASPTMKIPVPVSNTGEQALNFTQQSNEILELPKLDLPKRKSRFSYLKIFAPLAVLMLLAAGGLYFIINKQLIGTKSSTDQNTSASLDDVQLIPFRKGDKFGFVDANKIFVVDAKYYFVRPFSDGVAVVSPRGKYGAIDKMGKEIVETKYAFIRDFKDGTAVMGIKNLEKSEDELGLDNHKFGLIDKTGREIVPPKYDRINDFKEGFARVELNKKFGFIDKNGSEVIPVKYDSAEDFSEGLALVGIGTAVDEKDGSVSGDGKRGYIDKSGKEVIPMKVQSAESFSDGLALIHRGSIFFIDRQGNEVITFKEKYYVPTYSFSEGLARRINREESKFIFIDKSGNEIITTKTNYAASTFSDGLSHVFNIKTKKHGFIDKSGAEVVPTKYDDAKECKGGLCAVNIGLKFGKDGETIVSEGKWGYIDTSGKEVIPLKYDSLYGNYESQSVYEQIKFTFESGFMLVELNDKDFYIDKNGTEYYEP